MANGAKGSLWTFCDQSSRHAHAGKYGVGAIPKAYERCEMWSKVGGGAGGKMCQNDPERKDWHSLAKPL